MRVVKSEWHQVEKRYEVEVDEDLLADIYPDLDEVELAELMDEIESGDHAIEDIIEAAFNNGADIDWEWMDEDDWWTDRKGGYEVTYEVINE
mgnify:CR=1 FL=1|jgi:hypothetical protein|tara:strand:- start:1204 stop:1479 length:276 start_codon:yes stop_codon:yes gene_type:complete